MTIRKTLSLAVLLALSLALGSAAAEDKSPSANKAASAQTEKNAPEPDADTGELTRIESELAAVMDELVSARARASVLARSLFHTELAVALNRRAGSLNLRRVVLRLDGVPVHDSDGSGLTARSAQLFKGYVTPGRHELAIELVEAAKEDPTYGYTRNERYRVEVKKDRRTRVELVLRDDSDMAEEAAEGDEGEYQVETTVRVSSERVED